MPNSFTMSLFNLAFIVFLMSQTNADNKLAIGSEWTGDEKLSSVNDVYSLVLENGKLVLTQNNANDTIWTSDNSDQGQKLILQDGGELELVNEESEVVWTATPSSNCSAIKELRVGNEGTLKLVCDDLTVIWETPRKSSRASASSSSVSASCIFQHGPDVSRSISRLIFRRCSEVYAGHIVDTSSGPVPLVDDRGCGVVDAVDEEKAATNDICYATHAITTSFVVWTMLMGLEYDASSMLVPQMPKFRTLKHDLERHWMRQVERNARVYETLHIERFTLFDLSLASDNRTTRAGMLLQLRKALTREQVQDALEDILAMPRVRYRLANHDVSVEVNESSSCAVPQSLFEDSELERSGLVIVNGHNEESAAPKIGQSVNLGCQEKELRPERDDDNYDDQDGLFTLVCAANNRYSLPKKWPMCVQTCGRQLPQPPSRSGLRPIVPNGPVPIGQKGQYMCMDEELGVEQGDSAIFNVTCLSTLKFDVPNSDDLWPVCRVRTTTVHPAIMMGVDVVMNRALGELKERILADPHPRGWGDLDDEASGFFSKQDWYRLELITLPAVVGLMIGVLVLCACVSNPKSCCCLLFAAEQPTTKIVVPLDKQGNLEVEHYQRFA